MPYRLNKADLDNRTQQKIKLRFINLFKYALFRTVCLPSLFR